ncbi:MAG: SCO family protein [Cyclobacteriaceae bacterium]
MYRIVFLASSILISAVLLISCSDKKGKSALPYYNTPEFTPEFIDSPDEATQKITHTIASFSYTNQYNKTITEKDIEAKIHVANFIFTSCVSICPVMTQHMKLVQEKFGNNPNVVILSYSVTPWIDDVSRLKKYADDNEITSLSWHLLTGKKSEIYNLARQSYFAEEDLGFTKDSTEFLHTEHVLLIDQSKRIRGIYNGTLQLEIEQMIRDMEVLIKEEENL